MPTLMTSLTQRKGLASDVFGTLSTHADLDDDVTDREKDWLVTYLVPWPYRLTLMMTSLIQTADWAQNGNTYDFATF